MVRTADGSVRVGGKSAKKGGSSGGGGRESGPSSSGGSSDTRDHGGLNSIQQWDTPAWQKPITNFFQKTDKLPSIEPKHKEYAQPSQSCDMNDIEMKAADANDVDMQDKENTPPSTSKADVEIGENSNNNSVSNKRGMSDDEEGVILNYMVVPPKKPKLDAAMFQDVEEFE